MQELERTIRICHSVYIACLILAALFLIISVVLFIRFDIKKIFDIKTGRGARKTIQKMEEINARTGKLRQDMVAHTPVSLRAEDRITYPVTVENPQIHALRPSGDSAKPVEEVMTAPLVSAGAEETSILYQEAETTVLSGGMEASMEETKKELPGNFKVIKSIMWVHTKEVL